MKTSLFLTGAGILLSAQTTFAGTITLSGNTPFDNSLGTITRKTVIVSPSVAKSSTHARPVRLPIYEIFMPNSLRSLGFGQGIIDIEPFVGSRFIEAINWDVPDTNLLGLDYGTVSTRPVNNTFGMVDFSPAHYNEFARFIALPPTTVNVIDRLSFNLPGKEVDVPVDYELPNEIMIGGSLTDPIKTSYRFRNTSVKANVRGILGQQYNGLNFNINPYRGFGDIEVENNPVFVINTSLPYQTRYEYTPHPVIPSDTTPVKTPEKTPVAALFGFLVLIGINSLIRS